MKSLPFDFKLHFENIGRREVMWIRKTLTEKLIPQFIKIS
jgi:hypothetical protein